MRPICLSFILLSCLIIEASGQEQKAYTNFPIIITLNFHAFALPFRDIKANFSNIGIGVGTEMSFTGSPTGVQQVQAIWYHNKAMGNGLMLQTQSVWRPDFNSNAFGEIKGGVGYLYSFRPSESFQQVNSKWIAVGRKGKGMLTIPIGISAGINSRSSNTYISNFISYQFLLVKDYNKSIPVVPETLIQVGSAIH